MRHIIATLGVSIAFALSFAVAGCATTTPPIEPMMPEPPAPEETSGPLAIASSVDMSTLRPMADHQRERLRVLIDLAERREINEGGPRMLRVAKEHSRELDRIEARIDDAMRVGSNSGSDADEIQIELRRLSTRLDLLADTLR